MIDSAEITVIIKGLIVGNSHDKYSDRYTHQTIKSIRKYLPKSKIILSTWVGSDVLDLNPDEIIFNKDPGRLEMLSFDQKIISHISINNQIITSSKGLEKVETKYSLIIRSDMILTGVGFLKYFLKYNKHSFVGYLDKKIVVLPTYSPTRLIKYKNFFNNFDWLVFDKNFYNVSDWVYFGLTKDLKNIFSISLVDEDRLRGEKINGHYLVSENLSPEQYIWVSFLQKYEYIDVSHINYFSEERSNKSEESYAKNTIMISANKFGVRSLKYPGSAYGARPWTSRGFYTMSEYNKIYNKYNKDKIFYIRNYLEEFIYYIQINLRFFVRSGNKKLYKNIVNVIRGFNGNKDLLK
ncbi:MAG: WavE lipopolysaccharide synthesis family protein [Candidatus Paceibacterota bacterium]|jgi:hypothetical protein